MKNLHRSLIICLTPLQMLIAEKIISLNPDKQFDLLVIALSDNEKYKHYYQKLSKFCENSLYYKAPSGFIGFLGFIKKLKLNKLNIKYRNIYLASIDSRHIQYIISKSSKANIYTFDDGTANIMQNSIYYQNSKPTIPIWKRAIWRALGIKYYMEDIKTLSSTHYTIYKGLPNIISNTKYISLYQSPETTSNVQIKNTLRVYLGQPLNDISSIFDNYFLNDTLKNLNLDFYFPHPRERNIPLADDFIVINTEHVFEDYIITLLETNPSTNIEVFSFTSSALLNIAGLDRVYPKYIYNTFLYSKYESFYNLVDNFFNIPVINIS